MKRTISVALAALCLFFSTATLGYAAEVIVLNENADIAQALENLTDSLHLLSAIKASKRPVDPATHITAIQAALNRIIDLSGEEIKNLENRLSSLAALSQDQEKTRDEYFNQLADFHLYYKTTREAINQNITLANLLKISNALKKWREASYAPAIAPMVNFSAVLQNKNTTATAARRLAGIMKDEKRIRNALSPSKEIIFSQLIKKAQGAITQATALNARAEDALASPDNHDADAIDVSVDNADALIRQAYAYFIAMSKLLKK